MNQDWIFSAPDGTYTIMGEEWRFAHDEPSPTWGDLAEIEWLERNVR